MTNNIRHTSGPWAVRPNVAIDIVGPTGKLLATCYPRLLHNGYTDPAGLPESEANARLVAAAPDLLDAVKASRAVLTSILGTETESAIIAEQVAVIDAAIAKSEVVA